MLVEARVLLRLGALLLPSTSMNHCVGLLILHVHLFVADAMKSFDAVDGRILDRVLGCLGLLACYWHTYFLSFTHMFGYGSSWLLALVNLGHETGGFLRDARLV